MSHLTDASDDSSSYTYDAYGNITSETAAAVDHIFAFTGRERDEESDLQYNRARYYDATVGRWISEDPSGFLAGDSNTSRYLHNDPINLIDPSGLIEEKPKNGDRACAKISCTNYFFGLIV